MFLAIKAAPMVGSKFGLKLSITNLYTKLVFPTPKFIYKPESPSKTTFTSLLYIFNRNFINKL